MHLYIYSSAIKHGICANRVLLGGLERSIPDWKIICVASLDELLKRLAGPRSAILKITLLQIGSEVEVDFLLKNRSVFKDQRMVIMLDDESPAILSKLHTLAPRLIIFDQPEPVVLAQIMSKMAVNLKQGQAPWLVTHDDAMGTELTDD